MRGSNGMMAHDIGVGAPMLPVRSRCRGSSALPAVSNGMVMACTNIIRPRPMTRRWHGQKMIRSSSEEMFACTRHDQVIQRTCAGIANKCSGHPAKRSRLFEKAVTAFRHLLLRPKNCPEENVSKSCKQLC